MELNEIKKRIEEAVAEYVEADQAWGDSPMLEINPATLEMQITDEEVDESLDYVDMMDLLQMSVSQPGSWEPDDEAIASLAESYMA